MEAQNIFDSGYPLDAAPGAAEGGMSMSLEEYKHEIEAMLLEASMKLTCAEYEELTEWLRKEGLV